MINKIGPYVDSDFDAAIKKQALTMGLVTLSEIGVELNERKDDKTTMELQQENQLELQKEQAKNQPKTPTGTPGRPKTAKDKKQRKKRDFKAQTRGSDEAVVEVWLQHAQSDINDFLNDHILTLYNKKNFRQLNLEQVQTSEQIRFGVLFNLEPLSPITDEIILDALINPLPSEVTQA